MYPSGGARPVQAHARSLSPSLSVALARSLPWSPATRARARLRAARPSSDTVTPAPSMSRPEMPHTHMQPRCAPFQSVIPTRMGFLFPKRPLTSCTCACKALLTPVVPTSWLTVPAGAQNHKRPQLCSHPTRSTTDHAPAVNSMPQRPSPPAFGRTRDRAINRILFSCRHHWLLRPAPPARPTGPVFHLPQ